MCKWQVVSQGKVLKLEGVSWKVLRCHVMALAFLLGGAERGKENSCKEIIFGQEWNPTYIYSQKPFPAGSAAKNKQAPHFTMGRQTNQEQS